MSSWGWIGPARAMLLLISGGLGAVLAWGSWDLQTKPASLPSLVVDANSAPIEVLEALPGIGPVLASRIVAGRDQSPFRSMEDFDRRVKGIGPVTVAGLKPYLRFGSADHR